MTVDLFLFQNGMVVCCFGILCGKVCADELYAGDNVRQYSCSKKAHPARDGLLIMYGVRIVGLFYFIYAI